MTPDEAMTERLLEAAREAAERAHAPHSGFPVGAALLTADGDILPGCNVESASYGLTICAERVALTGAIARGHCAFETIALWTRGDDLTWPCGACLQLMSEFMPPDGLVLKHKRGRVQRRRLDSLLPEPFLGENLDRDTL